MAYNKNLYTSSTSALDAGIVYDQTETKMQSEVNAAIKTEVNNVKNTLTQLETATAQLDQNMAYVESGNSASRTYAVGDFISWKGTLYKASTAIPATTAFAVGTNLTSVVDTLGALCGGLNSLKSFTIKRLNVTKGSNSIDTFAPSVFQIGDDAVFGMVYFTTTAALGWWTELVRGLPNITASTYFPLFVTTGNSSSTYYRAAYRTTLQTVITTYAELPVGNYCFLFAYPLR